MDPYTHAADGRHSESQHARAWGPEDQDRMLDPAAYNGIVETTYTRGNKTKADRWTYLACPFEKVVAHKDAIVIAVKGACRSNGQKNPRGSIGVFLHQDSRLNRAVQMDEAYTSQRADLLAAIRGLQIALMVRTRFIGQPGPPGPFRKLRHVVLKTNSKYVVDAMTYWMKKWEDNGFKNAKGKSVVNEDLFRKLEKLTTKLEKLQVWVQFWHAPKGLNEPAYLLATSALDGVAKQEALSTVDDDDDDDVRRLQLMLDCLNVKDTPQDFYAALARAKKSETTQSGRDDDVRLLQVLLDSLTVNDTVPPPKREEVHAADDDGVETLQLKLDSLTVLDTPPPSLPDEEHEGVPIFPG